MAETTPERWEIEFAPAKVVLPDGETAGGCWWRLRDDGEAVAESHAAPGHYPDWPEDAPRELVTFAAAAGLQGASGVTGLRGVGESPKSGRRKRRS